MYLRDPQVQKVNTTDLLLLVGARGAQDGGHGGSERMVSRS